MGVAWPRDFYVVLPLTNILEAILNVEEKYLTMNLLGTSCRIQTIPVDFGEGSRKWHGSVCAFECG